MDKLTVAIIIGFAVLLALPLYADAPAQAGESSVFLKIKQSYDTPFGRKVGRGSCSGVYVAPHVILTAAHCFPEEKDGPAFQMWVSYRGTSSKIKLLHADRRRDLALATSPEERGTKSQLAASEPKAGDDVWAYGFPLRIPGILTKGIVANPRLVSKDRVAEIYFDSMVFPGSSGGGLFRKDGALVGIVVRTTSFIPGAAGLGIAVSVEEIRSFVDEYDFMQKIGWKTW